MLGNLGAPLVADGIAFPGVAGSAGVAEGGGSVLTGVAVTVTVGSGSGSNSGSGSGSGSADG